LILHKDFSNFEELRGCLEENGFRMTLPETSDEFGKGRGGADVYQGENKIGTLSFGSTNFQLYELSRF